jgi:predicted PurR-regulated permease PerM
MWWRKRARRDAVTPASEDAAPAPGRPYRGTMILVALAAATVTSIGISSIRGILAPVLLTLILTICAHPVRAALERVGVPHGLATGSVILVVFLLLAGFIYTLILAFAQFVAMLPDYSSQLSKAGSSVAAWLKSIGIGEQQIHQIVQGFSPSSIVGFFSDLLGSVFSITGSLVIILTMLILMGADALYVPTILRQLQPRQPNLVSALVAYASNVRRYMVVTTVLGVAQGVFNALALWIMHVPAPVLWGILSFLCSFVPNVGYFLAIIPPLIFGFFVGGWPVVIAIIIVYGVINSVIQSIIQPRVVGNAVALSQSITFFSVLFWAVVIGPIGAILAIPLTLLGRALLIDSDPGARVWRPVIGDTTETRQLLRARDEAAKADRRVRRGDRSEGRRSQREAKRAAGHGEAAADDSRR